MNSASSQGLCVLATATLLVGRAAGQAYPPAGIGKQLLEVFFRQTYQYRGPLHEHAPCSGGSRGKPLTCSCSFHCHASLLWPPFSRSTQGHLATELSRDSQTIESRAWFPKQQVLKLFFGMQSAGMSRHASQSASQAAQRTPLVHTA